MADGPAGSWRYIAAMSENLRFAPPRVEFDPTLANELARDCLRRRRIKYLRNTGKNPLPHRHRRDSRDPRHSNQLLHTLIITKEKKLVMNNGSAKRSPIQITSILRLPRRR